MDVCGRGGRVGVDGWGVGGACKGRNPRHETTCVAPLIYSGRGGGGGVMTLWFLGNLPASFLAAQTVVCFPEERELFYKATRFDRVCHLKLNCSHRDVHMHACICIV